LVAIENEVGGKRLSSAGSANNINCHPSDDLEDREEEEIGRIAGWAVNFEKLLKDSAGLAVFTVSYSAKLLQIQENALIL